MRIDVPYGISKRLPGVSLDEARGRATAALAAEGFGILTEMDLQKTLKAKLGVDTDPYLVLGACNPSLAHAALTQEPGVGLLLPCNVVLTTDGADAFVTAVSPRALLGIVGPLGPDLRSVAEDADARLRRAVDRL